MAGPGRAIARGYGEDLADRFWLSETRSHANRSLRRGLIAVTQIKSDEATPKPSQSIDYDEAFLVGLMIGNVPDHDLWQDGHAVRTEPFRAGDTAIFDLRRDPVSFTRTAHHSLHFYLPRIVLSDLANQCDRRFAGELEFEFAHGYDDPVIRQLGSAILPALERGDALCGMFLDHVLHAVAAHVLDRYGRRSPARAQYKGGLTKRQLRVAIDKMQSELSADISLSDLASACDLSVPHFSRAFRQSTGDPPHRWLVRLRIEAAMELLKTSRRPLSDIALECGFADQSHLSRTFVQHTGSTPARWRRCSDL